MSGNFWLDLKLCFGLHIFGQIALPIYCQSWVGAVGLDLPLPGKQKTLNKTLNFVLHVSIDICVKDILPSTVSELESTCDIITNSWDAQNFAMNMTHQLHFLC